MFFLLRTAECVRDQVNGGEYRGHGFWVLAKNYNQLHQMYQNLYEESLGEVLEFVDPSSSSRKTKNVLLFWGYIDAIEA